jgi:hypothetical protein
MKALVCLSVYLSRLPKERSCLNYSMMAEVPPLSYRCDASSFISMIGPTIFIVLTDGVGPLLQNMGLKWRSADINALHIAMQCVNYGQTFRT